MFGHGFPSTFVKNSSRLSSRQHNILNPSIHHNFQGFSIHSSFCQPHAFWHTAKPMLIIRYSPPDFRFFIHSISKRQNAVMVDLCHRIGVSRTFNTLMVCGYYTVNNRRMVLIHPIKQSGTNVKRHPVVVAYRSRFSSITNNRNRCICLIALTKNPFIPIGKWTGRRLKWYLTCTRVLSRRLIKVSVNTHKSMHDSPSPLPISKNWLPMEVCPQQSVEQNHVDFEIESGSRTLQPNHHHHNE